jgi:hypothetical protein
LARARARLVRQSPARAGRRVGGVSLPSHLAVLLAEAQRTAEAGDLQQAAQASQRYVEAVTPHVPSFREVAVARR